MRSDEVKKGTSSVRDRYIALRVSGPKSAWYQGQQKKFDVLSVRIRELREALANKEEQLRELLEERAQLPARQSREEAARARREFDRLVRRSDIEGVRVCGRKLILVTAPISIRYRGVTYAIGKFRVSILTDVVDPPLQLVNLTRRISHLYDHPNTYWGRVYRQLSVTHAATLLSEGRYGDLAEACLRFLKRYDATGPRLHISCWPVARCTRRRPVRSLPPSRRALRRTRERYVALRGTGRESGRYHRSTSVITELRDDCGSIRDRLLVMETELAGYRAALDEAASERAGAVQYGREFDRLLTNPFIDRLDISGLRLVVITKPIELPYGGSRYDIGRFRITIRTGGSMSPVQMVNLTRTVGHSHHPQGFGRRFVCFGNIERCVRDLLREKKYAALVNLCINFLQDWCDPAYDSQHWPMVRTGRR